MKHFPFAAILILLLASPLFAQSTTTKVPSDKTESPKSVEKSTLGNTKNVHRAGELYFAGQFTPEDLQIIKKEGFQRIITLRTDGEIDWDEKKKVAEAGIEFVEVPFRGPDAMTDPVIERIRKLLKDDSNKTLFHCGSANRVGGVWIPFRVLDEGVDLPTAVKEAKEIGLRNPGYEAKAVDYVKRMMASKENKVEEKSVKPGINDDFVDPELNVDDYLRRFEVESREVYLLRNEIVAAAEIEEGDFVADVGAGTGLFTRLFSKTVGNNGWVFAVDIAPKFIEHIQSESAKTGDANISTVLCSGNRIGLPPKCADVVFVCDTYHHFEFPKSTLASIHLALKDDGHLIVIDFERIPGKTREWLLSHVRGGKEVFRSEIQDAGFTLAEEKKLEGFKENYFLKFKKSK